MERITLAPGAHINVLPAEKFNRCRISINFIWPAAREWATAEALLPLVLERGYQGCPDMTELSKKLARLYGAALSVDGTMSGQSRVLTVSLSGIRDAFALAGEPLSREYADIAFGTAFEPYRVDGVLDESDIEAFKAGIELSDFTALPAGLEIVEPSLARVILREGKYHQVKRMLASRGKPVLEL